MNRVVELELWSKPRISVFAEDGKLVASACRDGTGLSEQFVLGLSFVPDEMDTKNLQFALAEGELTQTEFEQFCARLGLRADANDETSAAQFLTYAIGQPLAWLHLPESAEGLSMANSILAWAEPKGYIVKLGQSEPALSADELSRLWPNDA
jgi:hypothetical protein